MRKPGDYCRTCRHWQVTYDDDLQDLVNRIDQSVHGSCRINPPSYQGFPVVYSGSWCSHHDQRSPPGGGDATAVSNGTASMKEPAKVTCF